MNDIRLGARMLAKTPASSLTIAGLLALGIGTTTTMFSLFDAILTRPLPVKHPEELVRIVQRRVRLGTTSAFPYRWYEVLRDHATSFSNVFAEPGFDMDFRFAMTAPGPPAQISVSMVTPEFFEGLGVRALYGRTLKREDARPGSDLPPAVLSYGFWKSRFRGDPRVVDGGTIDLQRHRFAIVGVMPREFNGWSVDTSPDVRIPWRTFSLVTDYHPQDAELEMAARLKRGATRAQAEAECRDLWFGTMRPYYRDVLKVEPPYLDEVINSGVALDPLERGTSILRTHYGNALSLLMWCSGLLLVIACANIGGLLLARAVARQREVAVRLAVGATRGRIVRQGLVENSLLALAGAAGGIWFAFATARLAVRWLPPLRDVRAKLLPISIDVRVDWRVLLFAILVSGATLLLFSLAPAMAGWKSTLESILRGARTSRSSSERGRQILVGVQIALCTFLLALAGLFVRTFERLRAVDPGFDSAHVATFELDLMGSGISTDGEATLRKQLLERVRAIRGVEAAGISGAGVMRGHGMITTAVPEGRQPTAADYLNTYSNSVSPGYFETMGIRLLRGRELTERDTPPLTPSDHNIVVNEAYARWYFPGVDPIGKRVALGNLHDRIVGVVSDSKYRSLREPIHPTMYGIGSAYETFILNVRTKMRPEAIFPAVDRALKSIDPSLSFLEAETLAAQIDESMAAERLEAAVATFFGAMAALLAGVGAYGLLAQTVAQRYREIGIRMALGARASHIRSLIGQQILLLMAAGLGAGLWASLLAGWWMKSLVYGIATSDPVSLGASALFIVAIAVVAAVLPTRRAISIAPAETLRLDN